MFQSTNLLLQENTAKRFSGTHELSQKRRTPQSDVPTCTYISLAWHDELTVLENGYPGAGYICNDFPVKEKSIAEQVQILLDIVLHFLHTHP